ncbi:hypothetical protein SteCoe_29419 [Stentor coeruleus]|uniref:Uncharacterized protein n=1 Tax=Stentor coeruleus TaxID=5963 RepID=A0A1R2B603_9CILI|nr:hypothetical protein SteCoe_29419 [Stentor coeruleus]
MAEPSELILETHSEVKKHEDPHPIEHEEPEISDDKIHHKHEEEKQPEHAKVEPTIEENVKEGTFESGINGIYHRALAGSEEIIKSHEFLQPLHSQIKKNGKFHETFLSNYNTIAAEFTKNNTLKFTNGEIENLKFDWKSRSMQVSDDNILITGGAEDSTQVLIINSKTFSISELPRLNTPRELHTMTWIDFSPAVIGGCCKEGGALDSVEVFGKDSWYAKASIKRKRYGLSACTSGNKTWVFGGADCRNSAVLEIEVYENFMWTEINTKMPRGLVGIGAFKVSNEIWMMGGFNCDGKNSEEVFVFDVENEKLFNKKPLGLETSFSQNLWVLDGEYANGFGFRGQEVRYRLE